MRVGRWKRRRTGRRASASRRRSQCSMAAATATSGRRRRRAMSGTHTLSRRSAAGAPRGRLGEPTNPIRHGCLPHRWQWTGGKWRPCRGWPPSGRTGAGSPVKHRLLGKRRNTYPPSLGGLARDSGPTWLPRTNGPPAAGSPLCPPQGENGSRRGACRSPVAAGSGRGARPARGEWMAHPRPHTGSVVSGQSPASHRPSFRSFFPYRLEPCTHARTHARIHAPGAWAGHRRCAGRAQ